MSLRDKLRERREEKEMEENYGGLPEWILGKFGITEHHMDIVKSALDSVEKTEYHDRTEYNIDLKNIRVIIKK